MVPGIFRPSFDSRWPGNYTNAVDGHISKHHSILPYFQVGGFDPSTLPGMGEYSQLSELLHLPAELKVVTVVQGGINEFRPLSSIPDCSF